MFKSKADVLLGLTWGDEGKGKLIDIYGELYDWIVRFQGGPNAGHTVIRDINGRTEVIVLHTIPSSILNEHTKNLIGGNVLINPIDLRKEIEELRNKRLSDVKNLYISNKAQLILPTHKLLDLALEQRKGKNLIGTTGRGIGPAYADKTSRVGIRIGWYTNKQSFKQKAEALAEEHLKLVDLYGFAYDFKVLEQDMQEWMDALEFLSSIPKVDCTQVLHNALQSGHKVLIEGAQGTLLDCDMGSYPFVTSCNTTTGGACAALGLPPQAIGKVIGVFKAYTTRVGRGPFLTKILDVELANKIIQQGSEFGSTTGRKRDPGWIDIPALKYAIAVNGVTDLVMMKSDVLSGLPVKLCVGYKEDPEKVYLSSQDYEEGAIVPVYEDMPSWGDLTKSTHYNEFPKEFKIYIHRIEELIGIKIKGLSIGKDRTEYIERVPVLA
jgi:adenylosuccinate synthase